MKKIVLFTLFIAGCAFTTSAQNIIRSLKERVSGQGVVTIVQDPAISALIESEVPVNEFGERIESGDRKVIQATGYRVQVYAGSNSRASRSEAEQMSHRVKEYFPELPVYTSFASPRWLSRVGDFRSIEEADAVMRKLRTMGMFKEVIIVKDQINIHL